MTRRSRLLAVAIAAIAALISGMLASTADATQARPPANVKGLKIMLVNDDSVQGVETDGSDGAGLYELRKALCAAGADVLVVGPWTQQSGMSGRITTDRAVGLTVTKVTPPEAYAGDCASAASGGAVYGVCNSNTPCEAGSPSGSPADAVKIGADVFLRATYWKNGPDLVLSGINWGQNAGSGVVHSGTTGAAVTAHELGFPSIAFSEEFDLVPCALQKIGCPTYTNSAAFAVKFIGKLRGAGQIKPSLLLNVNFPFIGAGETLGKPSINVLGNGDMIAMGWGGTATTDGATYKLGIPVNRLSTNKNSDTAALMANKISIVPMDGDWSGKPSRQLTSIVKALR